MKLKQIVMVAVMGAALLCSATAMAKGTSCAKNQWLNGKKCAACPANASCNGKTFKCNKNFSQSGNKCVAASSGCAKNQWLDGKKCTACPANASCNGTKFTCKGGYRTYQKLCVKEACYKRCGSLSNWMRAPCYVACSKN